jgi:hypothetical protein
MLREYAGANELIHIKGGYIRYHNNESRSKAVLDNLQGEAAFASGCRANKVAPTSCMLLKDW